MTTKTKKPKKKKLTAAEKKIRREIFSDMRRNIKARRDADFDQTTLEQRKKFIGLMHEGKTLGKASEEAGMPFDSALEAWRRNIKKTVFHSLRPVEGVK